MRCEIRDDNMADAMMIVQVYYPVCVWGILIRRVTHEMMNKNK